MPRQGFNDPNLFGIKQLRTNSRDEFEREVVVLLGFAHEKNMQLLELLATFEVQEQDGRSTYYLILPRADGNVRRLW